MSSPILVDSLIRVPIRDLPARAREQLERALSYPNPAYIAAKKRGIQVPKEKVDGRWRDVPKRLEGFHVNAQGRWCAPRGAIALLKDVLVPWPGIADRRAVWPASIPAFEPALRPYQEAARLAMVKKLQGVVVIPAGGGKTYTALAALAQIGQRTLILVHTLDLLEQWKDEVEEQLGFLPASFSSTKQDQDAPIMVATVQALTRLDAQGLKSALAPFGCLILDEGHHCPASTFDRVVNACPARWRLALTATPEREDGLTPKLLHTFGPIIHQTRQEDLLAGGYLVPAVIHEVHTAFEFPYRGASDWQDMTDALAKDEARRKLVLDTLEELYHDEERVILVLSARVGDHLEPLFQAAKARGIEGELLAGKVKKDTRRMIRHAVRSGHVRVLFASTVADEGLNIPELNTLLLTFPAKAEGRVEQRVGRVMRAAPGKTRGDVYDFIDSAVVNVDNDSKPLLRQYAGRRAAYKTLRATIVKAAPAGQSRQQETLPIPALDAPAILIRPGGPARFAVGMDPSFTHFALVAVDLGAWWPVAITTLVTAPSDRKLGLRKADDDGRRLEILASGIRDFLLAHPPAILCCETPSSGAQSAAALKGLAYAKALLVAARVYHEVPTVWLLPGEIKEKVGGGLTATKGRVADVVRATQARDGRPWAGAAWDVTKDRNEHQYDATAAILAARGDDLFMAAIR
ncbi:MAG: DEAD/DEAH box helicase family protein [bacterium]|nr:DEAD/DEAH box helicase family protein [bacterium]